MDILAALSKGEGIRLEQAQAVVQLLNDGNTIPFIARYRKEATGSLDEMVIRQIQKSYDYLSGLEERRLAILNSIQEQGKLDDKLAQQISEAQTRTLLEDLYQPYKPKRKTRGSIAREYGLLPLAEVIINQPLTSCGLSSLIQSLLSEHVIDAEAAYRGAQDIVAEMISDNAAVRSQLREKSLQWGSLISLKIDGSQDPVKTYGLYYEFNSRIDRLKPYQILAINRGEKEKVLRVKIQITERDVREAIFSNFHLDRRSPLAEKLVEAAEDSAQRLLLPMIERDVRRRLTDRASAHAIRVFSENLQNLLLQQPIMSHVVLGIDPGFRTGCKLAVVDPTGKLLETSTIYPHEPQKAIEKARQILQYLVDSHVVTLIAIGNGTASRETESFVAEYTSTKNGINYLIVSEAGASVYSASEGARQEFPKLDVSLRGAVSIARRVQDPLAELVKIDPKSIGVGMYQHDVNQQELSSALNDTVERVVNWVGVDINTASAALLTYVSGIGPKLAEKIVAHREQFGPFTERSQLLQVSSLGPKAYEQSVGFIRIYGGKNPLDESAIHPESYVLAEAVLKMADIDLSKPLSERAAAVQRLRNRTDWDQLTQELQVGKPTILDVFEQLVRPGRDPRLELPPPLLRTDILAIGDLKSGQVMMGTVRNVVDFGVFVDIGVKHDGLLHKSRVPKDLELKVGEVIEVSILSVDIERGRISLGFSH